MVDSVLEEVSCSLCGKNNTVFHYKLKKTDIVECSHCQLNYVNPRVKSQYLLKKLQEWSEIDVIHQQRLDLAFKPRTLEIYQRQLLKLKSIITPINHTNTKTINLLDIGCSVGSLLTVARSLGWNTTGIEIGEASCEFCTSRLGLNVHKGSLYDFKPKQKYNLITFMEVIEHLPDPNKAIQNISKFLVPGGGLLITTPNYNSLFRKVCGEKWWVINCEEEHIYFFNEQTLSKMLKQHNFKVLSVEYRKLSLLQIIKNYLKSKFKLKELSQLTMETEYHTTSNRLNQYKDVLDKIGLLKAAHHFINLVDRTLSSKLSPLYGLGEQLIIFATYEPETKEI